MGWEIGYDHYWKRDVGYGVPAYCDHPGCKAEIDRGLSHVCGGEPGGGEQGCGLHFCSEHLSGRYGLCERCIDEDPPFAPKPGHPEWLNHKLTDESWQQWRDENPGAVQAIKAALEKYK